MTEVTQSAKAASKIRKLFIDTGKQFTLADINKEFPELKASQISMAICALMRGRYLTREQVPNQGTRGRKNVYLYTYHANKAPQEPINAS